MAGAVQWTINQFWAQLQNLKAQIDRVDSALREDKARLTNLYTAARNNGDPARDKVLGPLIHNNSVLRLTYLQPVKDKFNGAVAAASKVLRSAGYTTPNLSGLGLVVAIAPAAAVTAVLVATAAVALVWRMTEAQIARTAAAAAVFSDPNTTPAQKLELSKRMEDQAAQDRKNIPPPLGFDFGMLVPLAALVAVIVVGPQILRLLPGRRAAA